MRVGAPDELSAALLADRWGRDRCRIGQQSDDSWYLEFNRPPTPGPAAELFAEVRRWLAEERTLRRSSGSVSSRLPYRVNVAAAAHGPGAQHDVCAANNRVTSSPQPADLGVERADARELAGELRWDYRVLTDSV